MFFICYIYLITKYLNILFKYLLKIKLKNFSFLHLQSSSSGDMLYSGKWLRSDSRRGHFPGGRERVRRHSSRPFLMKRRSAIAGSSNADRSSGNPSDLRQNILPDVPDVKCRVQCFIRRKIVLSADRRLTCSQVCVYPRIFSNRQSTVDFSFEKFTF